MLTKCAALMETTPLLLVWPSQSRRGVEECCGGGWMMTAVLVLLPGLMLSSTADWPGLACGCRGSIDADYATERSWEGPLLSVRVCAALVTLAMVVLVLMVYCSRPLARGKAFTQRLSAAGMNGVMGCVVILPARTECSTISQEAVLVVSSGRPFVRLCGDN